MARETVSVPVRGFGYWKPSLFDSAHRLLFFRFSPREGIWLLETNWVRGYKRHPRKVSVPVRGFGYWKLLPPQISISTSSVSVPVRGFGYWKLYEKGLIFDVELVSVPVRGFGYWKPSLFDSAHRLLFFRFSPREGIWLLETTNQRSNAIVLLWFQSPWGDLVIGNFCCIRERTQSRNCFSPREGIWLLETADRFFLVSGQNLVSVPVRGFGYWKLAVVCIAVVSDIRFSPREGIWLLETTQYPSVGV